MEHPIPIIRDYERKKTYKKELIKRIGKKAYETYEEIRRLAEKECQKK